MMQVDSHKLATKLQTQLSEDYFGELQPPLGPHFVSELFNIAKHDPQTRRLILQHSHKLFLSKQLFKHLFLNQLLADKLYSPIGIQFVLLVTSLRVSVRDQSFQLNLIRRLPQVVEGRSQLLKEVISYLAQRMRSFDLQLRMAALTTLKSFGMTRNRQCRQVLKDCIPEMIEKQKLVRGVSFTRGLFLHLLEDEFSELRQLCIQTLIVLRPYFKSEDLKLVTIYMMNDEHELVRREALKASVELEGLELLGEDVETVLVCLREKRRYLRKYAYETLASITLTNPHLLLLLLAKTFLALQHNKGDKQLIYRMLMKLGKKYASWIEGSLQQILVLNKSESNCKSLTYKARMVVCYHWWEQLAIKNRFPAYFPRHILYLKDVQPYLFQEPTPTLSQIQPFKQLSTAQINSWISSQQILSQEFHRIILNVLRGCINNYPNLQLQCSQLEALPLIYRLGEEEQYLITSCFRTASLVHTLSHLELTDLVRKVIDNREKYEKTSSGLEKNQCKVCSIQPNTIIVSGSMKFRQRVVLKCWPHCLISQELKAEFKWIRNLPATRSQAQTVFIGFGLGRFSKVESYLLLPGRVTRLLDVYSPDVAI